jgi:hypothetical protein
MVDANLYPQIVASKYEIQRVPVVTAERQAFCAVGGMTLPELCGIAEKIIPGN